MGSQHQHIIIDGIGLLSPLGRSAWETFAALLKGQTMASRGRGLPADVSNEALVRAVGGVSVAQHAADDPGIELAELAAREAMGLNMGVLEPPVTLGASKGAMHALMRMEKEPGCVAMGPHGYMAAKLTERLRLPVVRSMVAACASSLVALHHTRLNMLHGGEAAQLVVTSEAALLPMFIGSYKRLGVLPALTPEGYVGKPLDEERGGFMLAELGAAVLLRRVDQVKPGEIELTDTAIAADGYDMIRTSANLEALRHVAGQLIGGREVDVLHPHATGTVENDAAELAVYAESGAQVGDVYACKGAVGHGLGAAGLVSLVLACLCARTRRRPAMPWLERGIEVGLPVSGEARRVAAVRSCHAVFAAGFGGHTAGAVIKVG